MAKLRAIQSRLKAKAEANLLKLKAASNRLKLQASSNRLHLEALSARLVARAELLIGDLVRRIIAVDLAAVTDAISKFFGRGVNDNVSSTDSATIGANKSPQDISIASDSTNFVFHKTVFDFPIALDIAAKSLSKTLTDSLQMSDVLTANLGTGTVATDTGSATDSAFVVIGKGAVESVATIEVLNFAFTKSLSDTFALQDVAAKSLDKQFSDSVSITDVLIPSFTTGQVESDSSSFTDVVTLLFAKQPADFTAFSDNNYLDIIKSVEDSAFATDDFDASADDNQVIHFEKNMIELSQVSDALARTAEYYREFEESGIATDSIEFENVFDRGFDDLAAVGDSIALVTDYSRTVLELPALSDSLAILVGNSVSDTMEAIDAGILLNQGYVDNHLYFADDYIGIKRIF